MFSDGRPDDSRCHLKNISLQSSAQRLGIKTPDPPVQIGPITAQSQSFAHCYNICTACWSINKITALASTLQPLSLAQSSGYLPDSSRHPCPRHHTTPITIQESQQSTVRCGPVRSSCPLTDLAVLTLICSESAVGLLAHVGPTPAPNCTQCPELAVHPRIMIPTSRAMEKCDVPPSDRRNEAADTLPSPGPSNYTSRRLHLGLCKPPLPITRIQMHHPTPALRRSGTPGELDKRPPHRLFGFP